MKVLLVNSYFLEKDSNEAKIMKPYPPLGMLYISAVLKQLGNHVEVFDGTFETFSTYEKELLRIKPDLVGIYSNVITRDSALEMVKLSYKHGYPVVLGGPDPSSDFDAYINAGAFCIVKGEGEETAAELVTFLEENNFSKELAHISGLIIPQNGSFLKTTPRKRIKNLDSIPLPDRKAIHLERYIEAWRNHHGYASLNIITSRGCPYHCTWCSKAIFGENFHQRSPEAVIEEVKMIKDEYAPDQLWFADDILTINQKWVLKFTALMTEQHLQIPFECLARVDLVDNKILGQLHLAGCYRIWYGGESGSQKIVQLMQKGFNHNQIKRAVFATQEHGIQAGIFILIGYPGETMADFFKTISMVKYLNPDACGTSVAYPIKGTVFYEQVKNRLSAEYSWSRRNENRIAFRGRYPEMFYYFAIRFVNNWAAFWRGQKDHDSILYQLLRIAKIGVTASAVLLIGSIYDLKHKLKIK